MLSFLQSASVLLNTFENPFLFALLVIGSALVVRVIHKRYGLSFFIALSLTFAATHIIKSIFKIPRPAEALAFAKGYRFPSMHTAIAGSILISIAWYACARIPSKTLRVAVYALAIIGTCFVGYTRLLLDVHKPIDVIVGGLLGVSVGLIVHILAEKYNLEPKN